jgi:hypothetical protein
MKTRALREHHEYYSHETQLTSKLITFLSIVKYIAVVVGIALMVFK